MEIKQLFIDKYSNGFPFGDFIVKCDDGVEIKVIRSYLQEVSFYFKAYFDFPNNKDKDSTSINYSSNLFNFVLLSLLRDKCGSLNLLSNTEIISLIKFVDEFGFCNKDKIITLCDQHIENRMDDFIDIFSTVEDSHPFDKIKNKITQYLEDKIVFGDDISDIRSKLKDIKSYSDEYQELNNIDKCINEILPIFGTILNKKLLGIKGLKARCLDNNTIILNYCDDNKTVYDRSEKEFKRCSYICKVLNKIFGSDVKNEEIMITEPRMYGESVDTSVNLTDDINDWVAVNTQDYDFN
jgi:hypothetical protein